MSCHGSLRPATIARVVYHGRRRSSAGWRAYGPAFELGDTVRSIAMVRNDGTYPRWDIGEVIVDKGDTGIVRKAWSFLGEVYYNVEFAARTVVVIMRAHEMVKVSAL